MRQLIKGLFEALSGALTGFILSALVNSFTEEGLIPWYIYTIFGLIGIITSLTIIRGFRSKGFSYAIGWIIGSWLLQDLLGTVDFVLLIVVPIIVLVIRIWRSIKYNVT